MPNWCENYVTFRHKDVKKLDGLEQAAIEGEVLQYIHPMPEELEGTTAPSEGLNWYSWCTSNWGTKWDACEAHIDHDDIDYFAVSFESAWSPPIAWIDNIMQDFPDLCFTLEYEEPGMGYGGRLLAKYEAIWDDLHWDIDQASECCEGPINWEHKELEQQCLICGEETETISMNVADIKPAKIKIT